MVDIVSARIMNDPLLDDDEKTGMGFGQVLPLVLLLSIVILVVDRVHRHRSLRKRLPVSAMVEKAHRRMTWC
jgi:hypothetical protein